jgi:hypothetical protein
MARTVKCAWEIGNSHRIGILPGIWKELPQTDVDLLREFGPEDDGRCVGPPAGHLPDVVEAVAAGADEHAGPPVIQHLGAAEKVLIRLV